LPTPALTLHHPNLKATSQLNISVTPSFLSSGVVTVRQPSASLCDHFADADAMQFNMAVQKVRVCTFFSAAACA
jgi:hypothetical protein